jgi:hypothetical protein
MKRALLGLSIGAAFALQGAWAAEPGTAEKLEILQQEIDQLKAQMAGARVPTQKAPASGESWVKRFESDTARTVVGGYGEAIYNNYRRGDRNDQADLRRVVLFLGHKFNDRLRFNSELEVEHGFIEGGKGGEVAMEQAYLEYGLSGRTNLRAGLLLVPLGILNETHEPPTFFGAERNQVESVIIPSTWRELGVALQGEAGTGLEYNVGLSTSLDAGKFEAPAKGLREARTAGGEAAANDLGMFAALNYRGIPGLLVGTGLFTGNTGQDGASNAALRGVNARFTLWDAHIKYAADNLELQALYARGTVGDADKVSLATGEVAPKSLYGWYTQAAYHVWKQGDMDLAPFIRLERYNTQEEVAAGFAADPLNKERVTTLGLNFKLHPQVVLKADYQNFKTDNTLDRFNLGIGYMF